MIRISSLATLVLAASIAAASPLGAQEHPHRAAHADSAARHEGMEHDGVLGIPHSREGSGTSWLPDASPMYAYHFTLGERWSAMVHGNVFLQYIDEGGDRGESQFGSVNWIMGMARRGLWGGQLALRAMLSAEPLTVGECGFPDLLATGEFCDGEPIVDRQHPHDLFMELSADYARALSDDVAFQLYGGPVAEPALGPVAFPHRITAMSGPLAPITHHWLDATHIAFGVATAGIFGRRWKVEGSLFNGREPDEDRYDFDFAELDSYSGRATWLPNERWALQISGAHLEEAEVHEIGEPRVDVDRYTASATYHDPLAGGGLLGVTAALGRNVEEGEGTNAVLVEALLNLRERHVLFARGELVEKEADDLHLDGVEDEVFDVGKITAGYVYQFGGLRPLVPGIGAEIMLNFVPDDLEPFYGSTTPVGFAVYVQLRPAAARSGEHLLHERDEGHEGHAPAPQKPDPAHAGRRPPPAEGHPGHAMPADTTHMRLMHELMMRMMADSEIRRRVMADTAMHRMMMQMMEHMPAEHREEMMRRMHGEEMPHRHDPARKPAENGHHPPPPVRH